MRYSTSSPESCGLNGGLLNILRSSQRFATSRWVIVCSGRGSRLNPRLPWEKTGRACGLSATSCAVTPASLRTLTKKERQPFSRSSALAGPCVDLDAAFRIYVDIDKTVFVEHVLNRDDCPQGIGFVGGFLQFLFIGRTERRP